MTIIRLDYKFRITLIERPLSFGEQVTQKFSNTPIKPRAILDLIREILPMMVKKSLDVMTANKQNFPIKEAKFILIPRSWREGSR